jgi:hypothetical protein
MITAGKHRGSRGRRAAPALRPEGESTRQRPPQGQGGPIDVDSLALTARAIRARDHRAPEESISVGGGSSRIGACREVGCRGRYDRSPANRIHDDTSTDATRRSVATVPMIAIARPTTTPSSHVKASASGYTENGGHTGRKKTYRKDRDPQPRKVCNPRGEENIL